MDGTRATVLGAVVGAVIAIVGLFVQGVQANRAIQQSNLLAWDYDGAQMCADYRAQVLDLWNRGVSEQKIINWFTHENGSENNPFGDSDSDPADKRGKSAYEDFEDGCGSVPELLASLEGATPEASKEPTAVP
jgi:hypothetical protein